MNYYQILRDYNGTFIRVRDIFAAENEGIHSLMDSLRIMQILFLASALVLETLYVVTTVRTRRREIGIHTSFGTPIRDICALLSGELFCSVFWGYGFAALCAFFFARPLALRIMNAASASTSMAAVQNTTGDMLASAAKETELIEAVADTPFLVSSIESAAFWIAAIFVLGIAVTFLRIASMKPMNLLSNREENL